MHAVKVSPKSQVWDMGDHIGMESCVDLKTDNDVQVVRGGGGRTGKRGDSRCCGGVMRREKAEEIKEYPPPIPWLARTGNLPPHMPFVLNRHYTIDGRLVITEEKVGHHEYFQSHRSHGRLTLQLVPLPDVDVVDLSPEYQGGDPVDDDKVVETDQIQNQKTPPDDDDDEDTDNGDGDENSDVGVESENGTAAALEGTLQKAVIGGGGKCYDKYKGGRSPGSCIFGMSVPPVRPVHI